MKNERKNELVINRDVIYAYKQPEIPQNWREETKIDELFENFLKANDDFHEDMAKPYSTKKRNFLSGLFGKSSEPNYFKIKDNAGNAVDHIIGDLILEQKKWYIGKIPDLYLGLKFGCGNYVTREDAIKKYQNFFTDFTKKSEIEIQKIKEETKNAHVLSIEEIESLRDAETVHIINVNKFTSGQIFIKHPFMPDTYMDIETSEAELFHIKMQCLSRIMQCLGARWVSGHAYVSEIKQREMDSNGKLSYKVVDVNLGAKTEKNTHYESDYILEDSFSGEFSESSYLEALEEAKRVGLYNDFDIKNLLEQRNPQKENTMTGRKIKIEMTRELNESLDVAFSLQMAGFGMSGAYKKLIETQKKVMFELDIRF